MAILMATVGSWAYAELNTVTYVTHDGGGEGRVEGDMTGVGPVTIYDGEGGDMWNGGDQFIYLHDEAKVTGDFSATVRVIGQTESVDGRWGKSGPLAVANLSGNGQMAMTTVVSGTGSQVAAPAMGDHSPVPVRIHGRRTGDGQNGFEPAISNSAGEISNNVFPESTAGVLNPTTNVSWLRLQYQEATNTFLSAFAPDVDGTPGEWGYSQRITNVDLPTEDDGPGWFVGLGYSVHNSMDLSNVEDEEGMHGITFDNYSIVDEFLPQELSVGGVGIGTLDITGESNGLLFGEPELKSGLAQYWFKGNMRPTNPDGGVEAFQDVGTTGNETFPLMNPGGGAIVNDTTWFAGSQNPNLVSGVVLPTYPPEVTSFPGWNGDQYGVKFIGEVFIRENGEHLIRDGIDDFTMIAIDVDGNGELDTLDEITSDDIGQVGASSIDDVHVLDDDWANLDGSSQDALFHGIADFEGIEGEGSWRKIEIWMSEDGGGDGAIVYMGHLDDPDIFDDTNGGALTQEEIDAFAIKQEDLRTTIAPIIGGKSSAALATDVQYIVEANADGADQIVVNDAEGTLETTLDVAGATIVVKGDGLAEGTSINLFDADILTGTDSLNLMFDDAGQWDVSQIASGVITFGAGGGPVCDPTAGPDIDGDSTVGFSDFLVLSNSFGQAVGGAGHLQGDLDCSGDVAFADFLALSNAFGQPAASSVPEPSGLALLATAGLLGGLVRRRRR